MTAEDTLEAILSTRRRKINPLSVTSEVRASYYVELQMRKGKDFIYETSALNSLASERLDELLEKKPKPKKRRRSGKDIPPFFTPSLIFSPQISAILESINNYISHCAGPSDVQDALILSSLKLESLPPLRGYSISSVLEFVLLQKYLPRAQEAAQKLQEDLAALKSETIEKTRQFVQERFCLQVEKVPFLENQSVCKDWLSGVCVPHIEKISRAYEEEIINKMRDKIEQEKKKIKDYLYRPICVGDQVAISGEFRLHDQPLSAEELYGLVESVNKRTGFYVKSYTIKLPSDKLVTVEKKYIDKQKPECVIEAEQNGIKTPRITHQSFSNGIRYLFNHFLYGDHVRFTTKQIQRKMTKCFKEKHGIDHGVLHLITQGDYSKAIGSFIEIVYSEQEEKINNKEAELTPLRENIEYANSFIKTLKQEH